MNKEDFDLIQKEFEHQKETNMKQSVITKSLTDKLFSKYNRCCYTILFYDDQPHIGYEEFERLDSTPEGRKQYEEMVKEYEPKRKRFNNWCDPIDEGIWGFTNNHVKKLTRELLKVLKKDTYKSPRFYIGEHEDRVSLYYYGRDEASQMDYWIQFWNEENRNSKCDSCKKQICWNECQKK